MENQKSQEKKSGHKDSAESDVAPEGFHAFFLFLIAQR